MRNITNTTHTDTHTPVAQNAVNKTPVLKIRKITNTVSWLEENCLFTAVANKSKMTNTLQ
jgi:hypothetical protein